MSDEQRRGPRGGEGRDNQRRGGQDRAGQSSDGQGRDSQGRDGRRDAAGRERNRSTGARSFSAQAPSQRSRVADPARLVAFEVLRAVAADDAYANLVLPARIRQRHLDRRDAGFATELAYGALRAQGTYDAILARCVDRPLKQLDPALLDALRLGAHQLLAMRVPVHAALNQTVGLVRAVVGAGPSSLANAVLRKVSAQDLPQWLDQLAPEGTEATKAAAIRHAHPEWIVRAFRQSLVAHGRPVGEIDALLEADNTPPVVNLVALPGIGTLDEALEAGFTPGPLAPDSALSSGGDPGRLDSVRAGSVRVQDAGSQLVARALAAAPLGEKSTVAANTGQGERWLDLCAGPGGKAALLAALAAEQGATLLANEPLPHRAKLVRQALAVVPHESWFVRTGDGRTVAQDADTGFDRILVDAPCTGLGALRRRPEARWRRAPGDVAELATLQRELVEAAISVLRPGGVLAYVTCSPHPAETTAVVEDVRRRHPELELLDAGAALDAASIAGGLDAGSGTAQLWPHLHQTDAMFIALLRAKD